MRKLKLLALVLCLLVPGLSLAGPDSLWTGVDDTPNNKTGDIVYTFGMCYDQPNDNWDLGRCTGGVPHVLITGPLGTQAEATSVATTPPTDAYYMVSRDAGANAINNPIAVRLSQDGTNALAAAYPIPISATMAANLTGNRIWVYSDMDMVAGTATNVNGGVIDAGTQTTTLATDDPAVTALEIMDDWDESDRAKVNLIVGQAGIAAGTGVMGVTVPRVTLATDDPGVVSLATLAAWDATTDAAVSTTGPQVMAEAHSAQPAAVDDGDALPFAVNLYGQMLVAGYQWASNAIRTTETNPLDTRTVNVIQVDVTDYAETAPPHEVFYYSANTGYRYNAWQLDLDSDNGTVTATVWCTLEPDCAPGDCAFWDATMDTFGVASLISNALPAVDRWVDNDQKLAPCTYTALMIEYNTGAANDDGDAWAAHAKWW